MDQTGGEIFDVTKRGQPEFRLRRADSTNKKHDTRWGTTHPSTGADGKPHKLDVRLAPSFGVKDATTTFSLKPAFYFR